MRNIDINFNYSKIEGSTTLHNKFKKEFREAASASFDKIIVLPYDVAKVRALSEPERIYQMGQIGVPDTLVLLPNIYLFFDQKTGKARLSKLQNNFKMRVTFINQDQRVFAINSIKQGLDIIRKYYNA